VFLESVNSAAVNTTGRKQIPITNNPIRKRIFPREWLRIWVKHTFSPWATNTGKNNRQISTLHSTGGAWCLSLCHSFFVNIVHIYKVSIRVRVRVRVKVSST